MRILTLPEITLEDLEELKRSVNGDQEQVRESLMSGRAFLWRHEGPFGRGVLLTSIEDDALFVWHMAGNGLIKEAEYIDSALVEFAKLRGLKRIKAYSKSGVARYLGRKLGYDRELVMKEI